MSKGKFLTFLTVVVAMVALFAAPAITAELDNLGTCSGGGYTLTVADPDNFPYLNQDPAGDLSLPPRCEYVYNLTGDSLNNITAVHLFVLTSPWAKVNFVMQQPGVVRPRGAGGTGSGGYFGLHNYAGVTVSETPLSGNYSENEVVLYTKPPCLQGMVSAVFDVGGKNRGTYPCVAAGLTDDQGIYAGLPGPGIIPEVSLTREYEYDSITGSGGLCIRKQVDQDFCIQALDYACYDPETEACPNDNMTWTPITPTFFEADYFGGHDPNVKCEGTLEIVDKHDTIAGLCEDFSTASFMDFLDFLGPSEANAACTCPPGIAYTSRRASYCICY